jgi:hypothetical protein
VKISVAWKFHSPNFQKRSSAASRVRPATSTPGPSQLIRSEARSAEFSSCMPTSVLLISTSDLDAAGLAVAAALRPKLGR